MRSAKLKHLSDNGRANQCTRNWRHVVSGRLGGSDRRVALVVDLGIAVPRVIPDHVNALRADRNRRSHRTTWVMGQSRIRAPVSAGVGRALVVDLAVPVPTILPDNVYQATGRRNAPAVIPARQRNAVSEY